MDFSCARLFHSQLPPCHCSFRTDGLPGAGLFLLRIAIGITIVLQVTALDWGEPKFATWALGILGMASAALILVGFLTPLIGSLALLLLLGFAAWNMRTLFDSDILFTFDSTMMVLSIVLLGPGRFSIDAYLFGRRHIIIPARSHSR